MDSFFSAYGFELFVAGVIIAAVVFVRQRQHRLAGNAKVVKDQLDRLGAGYTVLSHVVVSAERGMMDVKHVVVSAYGVFVVTVKTEAGKVFGREGGREWQVKPGGDTLYNPLWENRKHVNALEKMIGSVRFIPVIVFTRAALKGEFGDHVIGLKKLIPYIAQNKTIHLSSDQCDEIVQKLRRTAGGS